MMSTHYRKPMDWTEEKYARFRNELFIWDIATANVEPGPIPIEIIDAISDDINTPEAITVLRSLKKAGDKGGLLAAMNFLGLKSMTLQNILTTDETTKIIVESLLVERKTARQEGNWSRSDQIRDKLLSAGIHIQDTELGTVWGKSAAFNFAKLEA